jgi:hypothetical protein
MAPATVASAGAEAANTTATGNERGISDEYEERSLRLVVSREPEAYKRASVRAEGFADSPLELWVYEDPRGRPCAATAAARQGGARALVTGLDVEGAFSEQQRVKLTEPGRHTFCSYLGPDQGSALNTSFESRKVRRPLLRAARARHTVGASFRRHDFSDRVIKNLNHRCRRRNRSRFSCRFSSRFPGYKLSGHGSVVLKKHLSYRFRARVGKLSFTLTDENEGRFPG